MSVQERTNQLFQKYLAGTCTSSEWEELLVLVANIDENDAETLTKPLYQLWLKAGRNELERPPFDKEKLYKTIIQSEEEQLAPPVRRIRWWRIAAAAVFIGVIVTAGVFFFNRDSQPAKPRIAEGSDAAEKIKPGTDKAILTLANGQQIVLDSSATGTISQQGNVKVINLNGQLAYEGEKNGTMAEMLYNTVTTANANQYQLVLRDGTKVWLNAASSIRFPADFVGTTRTVEITGEAYFEVAKDASKPFHVKVNGTDIEVLGTHFNVNAYTDEAVVKTSLLEGSVKITSGNKSNKLAPGQEANVTSSGDLTISSGNVDMSVAWVKGYFQFDQAPLPVIMRQIGRWYDLDIKYEGAVPDRIFKGKIQRTLPLSSILNLLRNGDIQFRVEGKTLVITG